MGNKNGPDQQVRSDYTGKKYRVTNQDSTTEPQELSEAGLPLSIVELMHGVLSVRLGHQTGHDPEHEPKV